MISVLIFYPRISACVKKFCKTDFFKHLFSGLRHISTTSVFLPRCPSFSLNHLISQLLFSLSFPFLCFSIWGLFLPPPLAIKQNYPGFCSDSLHIQLHSPPTGRHSPSTCLPQIRVARASPLWRSVWQCWRFQPWPPVTTSNTDTLGTGTREPGGAGGTSHPPSAPTCSSHTSRGHLHLQGLPHKGGSLTPAPHETQQILSSLTYEPVP